MLNMCLPVDITRYSLLNILCYIDQYYKKLFIYIPIITYEFESVCKVSITYEIFSYVSQK